MDTPTVQDVMTWIGHRLTELHQPMEAGVEIDLGPFIASFPAGQERAQAADAVRRAGEGTYIRHVGGSGTLWALRQRGEVHLQQPAEQTTGPRRATLLFLSHAATDKPLALRLKEILEKQIPGLDVFVSSDPADLPPGERWPKVVQQNLSEAGALLLVTTSRALGRPWVWFELGSAWFLDNVPKLLLCFGSVRKNALPAPLNDLQAVEAGDQQDFDVALRRLAQVADLQVSTTGSPTHREELVQIEAAIESPGRGPAVSLEEVFSGNQWLTLQTSRALSYLQESKLAAFTVTKIATTTPLPALTRVQLQQAARDASFVKASGWPVGFFPDPRHIHPIADGIEAAFHEEFIGPSWRYWALGQNGGYVHASNLLEDENADIKPGTMISIDYRVEAVAEAWLFAATLYRVLNCSGDTVICCEFWYAGVRDRVLRRTNGPWGGGQRLTTDIPLITGSATIAEIHSDLVAVVKRCAAPLFELFEFYELPDVTYQEIVERTRFRLVGKPV